MSPACLSDWYPIQPVMRDSFGHAGWPGWTTPPQAAPLAVPDPVIHNFPQLRGMSPQQVEQVLKDAAVAAEASKRKCQRIRWPEHFVSPNQAYEFVLDFVFLVVLRIFGFCARFFASRCASDFRILCLILCFGFSDFVLPVVLRIFGFCA